MSVKLAPIDLSAEVESYSRPEPGQEFWQQSGFTFVGSSDGMDFLLWTRICIISGRKGGQWLHTGQTIEHATTLIMVPSERRGELTDHTFISNGLRLHNCVLARISPSPRATRQSRGRLAVVSTRRLRRSGTSAVNTPEWIST